MINKRNNVSLYAAIILERNSCHVSIVESVDRSFEVIRFLSQDILLGGATDDELLSEAAISKLVDFLISCADKLKQYNLCSMRCVATQIYNGKEFMQRIYERTGLNFEILSHHEATELSAKGCGELFDRKRSQVIILSLVEDSFELIHLGLRRGRFELIDMKTFPLSAYILSERFDTSKEYSQMIELCSLTINDFVKRQSIDDLRQVQIVAHSDFFTTLLAVQLGLKRYDASLVDGKTLSTKSLRDVIGRFICSNKKGLESQPCVGEERAPFMLAACSILEAVLKIWPVPKLCVTDRGIENGLLLRMIRKDQRRFDNKSKKYGSKT